MDSQGSGYLYLLTGVWTDAGSIVAGSIVAGSIVEGSIVAGLTAFLEVGCCDVNSPCPLLASVFYYCGGAAYIADFLRRVED